MKKIPCACPNCKCPNRIDVPNYVPDDTPIVCEECQLEHPVGEIPESTGGI